jgi:hypothetical protein
MKVNMTLLCVIENDNKNIVKLLLDNGENVNKSNKDVSPLEAASQEKTVEMLNCYLIKMR